MIRKLCTLTLLSSVLLISCNKSNEKILEKTNSRLNSIESIEYQVISYILQKETGMDEIDTAVCYFDFTSPDSLLKAKYHFLFNQGEDVYDGKNIFLVDKKNERIVYNNEPKIDQVKSSFFITNSIYQLKKMLPEFLIDTSIVISRGNDTLINGEENYSFNISIKDRYRYLKIGAILTEGKGGTINYNLFISKKSYLPTQFIYVFDNDGFWKATFSNINLSALRSDSIWEYERFPQNYLRMSGREFAESMKAKEFIKVGEIAPNWSLPLVSGSSIQLYNLKGNLVLLEFWFPYCGGCVQAIPEINKIQDIFSNKNLKVYGIEFTRTDHESLDDYIRKQRIEYPTLYKGQTVAKDYGVNAAPTFFLIDKKGLIVYSSVGLFKDELIKVINDNI